MRRVRTKTGEPSWVRAQLDGGLFEVASQRSTSGTWKRVTLVSYDGSVGLVTQEGRGYRERLPRSNCTQERSGRTDRGPAEPHGAHIPKSALPVALRGGGPSGGAADSLIAGSGALRSIRSAMRRPSLRSLPASSVSELSAGCVWRAGQDYRCRSPPPRRGRYLPGFHRKWRDDDVGVLVGLFANAGSSFVDLE